MMTLGCALGVMVSAVQGAEPEPELPPIKVGFLIPPEEPDAVVLRAGAESAARQGVGGRRVELVVRGRVGQWGDDGAEAGRMALDDAVFGLVSPPDGAATHLVLQVAGRTAIPVVALCADSSVRQTGIPWMVQLVPDTQAQAAFLFQRLQAVRPAAPRQWVAIVPPGRSGREAGEDLHRAARGMEPDRLSIVGLADGAGGAGEAVDRALAERPAVVFLWLDAGLAGDLSRRFREAGYQGLLAGPMRLQSQRFIEQAGPGARGFLVPGLRTDLDAAAGVREMRRRYREDYGKDPDVAACLAYDAVVVLATLAAQPGPRSSRPFAGLGPLPGASGEIRWDAEGRRAGDWELRVWRGGGWSPEDQSETGGKTVNGRALPPKPLLGNDRLQ